MVRSLIFFLVVQPLLVVRPLEIFLCVEPLSRPLYLTYVSRRCLRTLGPCVAWSTPPSSSPSSSGTSSQPSTTSTHGVIRIRILINPCSQPVPSIYKYIHLQDKSPTLAFCTPPLPFFFVSILPINNRISSNEDRSFYIVFEGSVFPPKNIENFVNNFKEHFLSRNGTQK